jgi:hypothetical protein
MNRAERDELAQDLRTWALAYAKHGWAVHPLKPGTNVPRIRDWPNQASTDPDVVAAMWDRWPLANPGIVTGKASGLYVVDVDPKSGGDETLAKLVAEHGPVPAGPVARTPSGGTHYYFQDPGGLRNTAGELGQGIDTRADGGQVAAPPGNRPDGGYTWAVHPRTPLPELPDWLTPAPKIVAPIRRPAALGNARPDRILAGNERIVLEAPEGRRNPQLFVAACFIAEHAVAGRVSFDEGAAVLLNAAISVGLSEREALKTIAQAAKRIGIAS